MHAPDPAPAGSLEGLRVLDLSRVLAGPLCTQMLGDHGATVVKVEPPSGDETRSWGPPFLAEDVSAYFTGLNRNKANICLDFGDQRGRAVLAELMAAADVLVENYKVGTLAGWGWSDEALREQHPALIHCRITGFGADGPMGAMPGYDAVCQAYSGLMSINGEPSGPPLRVGVPIVDMVTGMNAFAGILLALRAREQTGQGQLVDCTLIDSAVSLLHPHSASWLADGRTPTRTGSAHPTIAPYDNFDASDGLIFIGAGNDRQFAQLVDELGCAELLADSRFNANADRVRNVGELRPRLSAKIRERCRHPLAKALLSRGVPATPVHDVGEALSDAHVVHRHMVVESGGYRGVGVPIKLERTPATIRRPPVSRGHDTDRVLRELGLSAEHIEELVRSGVAMHASSDGDDDVHDQRV
jgi:crotonobetainyl-CoA:carnitine CoA-transferase CaiB-like acyl-CoA transferase